MEIICKLIIKGMLGGYYEDILSESRVKRIL